MKQRYLGRSVIILVLILTLNQVASAQTLMPFLSLQGLEHFSAKDVSKFMKNNFKFVEDQKLFGVDDYWQSPEEFLMRKKGDCEDYALFTDQLLRLKGFESWVISFYDASGYGHTVTFFKVNGKFNVMNEDRLYQYQAHTISEGLTKIHPSWTWAAFSKKENNRGVAIRTFQNPVFTK